MDLSSGWKRVLRDAAIIVLLSWAVVRSLTRMLVDHYMESAAPINPALLSIPGLLFNILCFAVAGYFVKGGMWKHLLGIALVLVVWSMVNLLFSTLPPGMQRFQILLYTLPGIVVSTLLCMGLGGLVARTARGMKGRR